MCYITTMYAGKICKKCGNGCNNDRKRKFLTDFYKKIEKRFNGYVCSFCVTEMIGGENETRLLQSKQILKEMGI